MIQLSSVLWMFIVLFGAIGFIRGFSKEFVALAGILLALFTLVQFESFFESLGRGAGMEQIFYVQALFLLVVTFFAYETPPDRVTPSRYKRDNLDNWQSRIIGGLVGGFNAYLVFGSLWYFMDQLAYPLSPFVSAPHPGSASAEMVSRLPLVWLQEGNLLTVFVIVLFLYILIAIV